MLCEFYFYGWSQFDKPDITLLAMYGKAKKN